MVTTLEPYAAGRGPGLDLLTSMSRGPRQLASGGQPGSGPESTPAALRLGDLSVTLCSLWRCRITMGDSFREEPSVIAPDEIQRPRLVMSDSLRFQGGEAYRIVPFYPLFERPRPLLDGNLFVIIQYRILPAGGGIVLKATTAPVWRDDPAGIGKQASRRTIYFQLDLGEVGQTRVRIGGPRLRVRGLRDIKTVLGKRETDLVSWLGDVKDHRQSEGKRLLLLVPDRPEWSPYRRLTYGDIDKQSA